MDLGLSDVSNGNGLNDYLARMNENKENKENSNNNRNDKEKSKNKNKNKNKYEIKEDENNDTPYECGICFCEYSIDEVLIFEDCHHYYCLNCLMNTCKVKIDDKVGVNEIHCPFEDCEHLISYQEIELILTNTDKKELFEKYEKYLLEVTLQIAKNCKVCPAPNCGFPMFADPNDPMLQCPKCGKKFCFNCETTDWHTGVACEAFQRWKLENNAADAKFAEWANQNTKECPRCKARIEKNGGCNHMTCKRCKYEFHWQTLAKWQGYQHDYGAPIYPNVPQGDNQLRNIVNLLGNLGRNNNNNNDNNRRGNNNNGGFGNVIRLPRLQQNQNEEQQQARHMRRQQLFEQEFENAARRQPQLFGGFGGFGDFGGFDNLEPFGRGFGQVRPAGQNMQQQAARNFGDFGNFGFRFGNV